MARGYVVLNTIRVCSIITLVMAVVAAMATLVKSFILSKFFLFDVLNNLILSTFCVLIFFSELELFPSYYERRWPLFGPRSSLVGVGVAEIVIGFQLLGNLNERYASKENIGYSFNALLMAAGITISAMGLIVFIASYIFSNSQTHTTARTVRSRAHNSSGGAKLKPTAVLEEVRVASKSIEIERPQRSYSQSSRIAPSVTSMGRPNPVSKSTPTGRIERSTSATSTASSRGPFPYASQGGVERSYSGPTMAPVHERSNSATSKAPSSFYSEISVADYYVKENPYSPPARNPYA